MYPVVTVLGAGLSLFSYLSVFDLDRKWRRPEPHMHVPVWCVSIALITTASCSNINQSAVIANLAPLSATASQKVLIRLVSTRGRLRLGTNPVTGDHAPAAFVASVT